MSMYFFISFPLALPFFHSLNMRAFARKAVVPFNFISSHVPLWKISHIIFFFGTSSLGLARDLTLKVLRTLSSSGKFPEYNEKIFIYFSFEISIESSTCTIVSGLCFLWPIGSLKKTFMGFIQDQQLFTIYHIQPEMSWSIWVGYDQPMLSLKTLCNNGMCSSMYICK